MGMPVTARQKTKPRTSSRVTVETQPAAAMLQAFKQLVGPEELLEVARRFGVIERQRKLDLPALVEATIISLTPVPGMQSTIRLNYLALANEPIAASSFYDRFDEAFATLLEDLAHRAVRSVREVSTDDPRTRELGVLLEHFHDVRAVDSTCKLLSKLARSWAPSTSKKRPAAMKLNAIISLRDHLPVGESITPQRTHDSKAFEVLEETALEPGTLTLFDLGYVDHERFVSAAKRGAHFLTRLKESHDPVIERVHVGRGRRTARGVRLSEAIRSGLDFEHGVLDLDVTIEGDEDSATFRVVGLPSEAKVHWYLTTVPRTILTPPQVGEAYRLRWDIELLFKQLKSGVGLETIKAWRPEAVRALVYAKVIALCLARLLQMSAEKENGPQATTQLALVLALTRMAPLLLTYSFMTRGFTIEKLEQKLLLIAADVAKSRNQRREREKRKRREVLGC